jgi:hypothetical protein
LTSADAAGGRPWRGRDLRAGLLIGKPHVKWAMEEKDEQARGIPGRLMPQRAGWPPQRKRLPSHLAAQISLLGA